METITYPTIRVDPDRHGDWEVEFPETDPPTPPIRCRTLNEARRLAYRHAIDRRPCELVICDAYHRVAHHELVAAGDA